MSKVDGTQLAFEFHGVVNLESTSMRHPRDKLLVGRLGEHAVDLLCKAHVVNLGGKMKVRGRRNLGVISVGMVHDALVAWDLLNDGGSLIRRSWGRSPSGGGAIHCFSNHGGILID